MGITSTLSENKILEQTLRIKSVDNMDLLPLEMRKMISLLIFVTILNPDLDEGYGGMTYAAGVGACSSFCITIWQRKGKDPKKLVKLESPNH